MLYQIALFSPLLRHFATELQHNIRYFAAENLRLNAEF